MKAHALASEFVRIFTADADFAPVDLRTEQEVDELSNAEDDYKGTRLVFTVSVTPLDAAGRVLQYALALAVETTPDGEEVDDEAHAEWVAAAAAKFFGEEAGDIDFAKQAMKDAMEDGGLFTLRNYDAGSEAINPEVENTRFRTLVPVRGIAFVVGSL